MSNFGLQVTNDSGVLQLDDTTPILVYLFRGTVTTSTPGTSSVTFPKPVKTNNPPQIFLRIYDITSPGNLSYIVMLGSPGNWTGFTLRSASGVGGTTSFEWVATVDSKSLHSDGFGLEVYGPDGTSNFNSEFLPVFASKVTTRWTYQFYFGNVRALISDVKHGPDEFVSISSLNNGYEFFGDVEYIGLSLWGYGQRDLSIMVNMWDVGSGPQDQYSVNIGIPICKFPIDKYL